MQIRKSDWLFIILAVAVLAIFIAISGKEKTKLVPYDAIHRDFYSQYQAGKKKIDIDPQCAPCHDGVKIPFPDKHPAKPGGAPMRCLFCHKFDKAHAGT